MLRIVSSEKAKSFATLIAMTIWKLQYLIGSYISSLFLIRFVSYSSGHPEYNLKWYGVYTSKNKTAKSRSLITFTCNDSSWDFIYKDSTVYIHYIDKTGTLKKLDISVHF
jgi:hypothetical protein